jgi:hypothetical protein
MRDKNYREALLAYIDVLGFKKLIEKSVADAQLFADILSLLRHLKDQTGQGGRYVHEEGKSLPVSIFRAFNFSDLTVRATYADTATNYFSLCQWEFLYLCSIQVDLVCRTDFLVRGAISMGPVAMEPDRKIDDDILFGPALIRAYEMEKEKPGPPRIVIDSPVIEEAGKHRGGSLWMEHFHMDTDGKFFLDYLFGAAIDGLYVVNNKPVNLLNTLQAHKEAVERRIKNLKDEDAGVIEKHSWLVSYHNGTLERLKKHYGPEQDRFDILAPQPMDIPNSLKIDPSILGAAETKK